MATSSPTPTDPCAFPGSPPDYDKGLHIAGIFIILAASILGTCMAPIAERFPQLTPNKFYFILGKHIGTGVICALALIHLLAPAFTELGWPCLANIWIQYQFAPLFALAAALVMHFVESAFGIFFGTHDEDDSKNTPPSPEEESEKGHSHGGVFLLQGKHSTTMMIAAYILEFGLTTHSVIIGITVGVTTRSDLDTLLPALCFHQFFEGFALGARLAAVGFSAFTEIILILIYSLSAPVGIAIGVGVYQSYNPNSARANLIEGSFDSISAGILLYVGFCQMIAIEFERDMRREKSVWRKLALFICVWFGAGVMAVIGKWL